MVLSNLFLSSRYFGHVTVCVWVNMTQYPLANFSGWRFGALMCADSFLLNKILQKKKSPSWKSGSGIYQNSRLAPFCANLSRSGALYVCSLVFPWNLMHYSKFFAAIGDLEHFLLLFSGRGKVGSRANCFPSLKGNCHRQACRPRNEVIFCVF